MGRILTLLLTLVLAGGAWAQDTGLRQMNTGEDSKGWGGVGRLEIGGRSFCTGSLIAPDLVLTAAHCLYDRKSGQPIDAAKIEFRAGWRNGRAEAYRSVRRAVVHPDYQYTAQGGAKRVLNDLAVLRLYRPIRNTTIIPFETVGRIRKGAQIGVVSYAVGREDAPSFQQMCRVLGRQQGVYVMSCSVDFGSSGAPVFAFVDGAPRIASVVSAKAEMQGSKVSLGMGLDGPLEVLLAELDENRPVAIKRLSAEEDRRSTGAKFVRADGG